MAKLLKEGNERQMSRWRERDELVAVGQEGNVYYIAEASPTKALKFRGVVDEVHDGYLSVRMLERVPPLTRAGERLVVPRPDQPGAHYGYRFEQLGGVEDET